jgi:DMSO/TMAO reductase YedYZ molybdopterin-dependent catalytic subunit
MTRRELMSLAALAVSPAAAAEPTNESFPLRSVEGRLTPPELFFVREHFPEPSISLRSWRICVEGKVERPLMLNLSDVIEAPTHRVEAVLECAGNVAGGSAVSNGIWEGVPLSRLLDEARPTADAPNVLLMGADRGRIIDSSSESPYARLIPIEKCRDPRSTIAFKLNDRFLPRRNGFPARAVFPGWYGMDCVKWLERIVVLGRGEETAGYQTSGMDRLYMRVIRDAQGRELRQPLTNLQVKSAIAWPAEGAKLPLATHTLRGFAWSGAAPVQKVEFSVDGGRSWDHAKLLDNATEFGWIRWSGSWSPKPGRYVILSRATDGAGNIQPLKRDPARRDGYELNTCAPVSCEVL